MTRERGTKLAIFGSRPNDFAELLHGAQWFTMQHAMAVRANQREIDNSRLCFAVELRNGACVMSFDKTFTKLPIPMRKVKLTNVTRQIPDVDKSLLFCLS